jgi:hypothetical protein
MSYVSKEEQEEQKWMTLKEAISHIQRVDGCDQVTAFAQLRTALAEEAVTARFKTSATSRFYAIDLGSSLDPHWPRRKFWLSVRMDLEGDGHIATVTPEGLDKADDQEGDVDDEDGDWGPVRLFVLRSAILDIWADPLEGAREGPLESPQHQKSPGKAGQPASKVAIRKIAREVYDEAGGEEGPNVEEAYHLIREKLAAASKIASRELVRDILDGKEFKDRRRPVGRRSSKK